MRYHDFESLQEMHVEVTNRCNASCPMCARNYFGGADKEGLQLDEWSVEDGKKVFSSQFVNLRNILFCGTHGDPAVAKHTLDLVSTVRSQTSATIEFYTNGSVRSPQWWRSLGELLRLKKADDYYRNSDLGIFSIDGLHDTNHLYRRKTQFDKIIENAKAFIEGGGKARWDFIVFKHNQHQVEEAEKLAKKIGFKQFRIRKTTRFSYSPDGPDKHRVLNNRGELEYYLEPTTDSRYLNENKNKFDDVVKKAKSRDQEFFEKKIQCLNKSQFQRIYINAMLQVFPCCFISSDTYPGKGANFKDTQDKVWGTYGYGFNSLRQHSWQHILDHPWFSRDLVSSWDKPSDKLVRCQRTCSVQCNPITTQSEDKSLHTSQATI